eukprot:1167371-Amphidinium_carterae.1
MSTTTVGVVTAVHSGKRDAGHLETFTTGMDFEDKYTTTNRQMLLSNACIARKRSHGNPNWSSVSQCSS